MIGSPWELAARVLGPEGRPAVVALHGLASTGVTWLPSLQPLARRGEARVFLPDLLGHGASPWPPDAAYDVDQHLASLDRWAAGLGLYGQPLTLAGCSMGAVLAAEWAARLPAGRVRAVVLVCLPLFRDAGQAARTFASSDPVSWLTVSRPRLAEQVCRRTCGPRGLATRLARRLTPREADWNGAAQAWRLFPESMFLHSWESLSRSLERCLLRHRAQPAIRALAERGTPLTFVHGAWDRLAPYGPVRDLARETGASLVGLPRGTHGLQLTHAGQIEAAVRRALSAPAARPTSAS